MKLDFEKLKQENLNLSQAYRDKARKYQQLDNLYSNLKRKEMTAATQSAAYDTADEVLQSASARQNLGTSGNPSFRFSPRNEPIQTHSTNGNLSVPHQQRPQQSYLNPGYNAGMQGMAPPPRPSSGAVHSGLGARKYRLPLLKLFAEYDILIEHNPMTTPSNHRTRLGPGMQTTPRQPQSELRPNGPMNFGPTNIGQTPPQRSALGNISNMPGSRSGVSGYGMSAGMKIGRQQGRRHCRDLIPVKGD